MTENKYSKILVLGAGPVIIGSSSEYDYSAVSVCRALKEEGIDRCCGVSKIKSGFFY